MNAQFIADYEGKLINIALTNDSIKNGTVVNVNDEYFMLKAEGEEKARDVIYYDEVKEVKTVIDINLEKILNQYVEVHFTTGGKIQGVVTSIDDTCIEVLNKYNDTLSVLKVKILKINEGYKKEQEFTLHKDTKIIIKGWKEGKYLFSLCDEQDLKEKNS